MRDTEKEAEGEAGSLRDLIPGPWDHDLSQRQALNHLSHPGVQGKTFSLAQSVMANWWVNGSRGD